MDNEKLKVVLEKHKMWLNGLEGGERLDLSNADLCNANLRYADLRDANLRDANMRGANLCDANLSGADLRNANLRYADLRDANLCHANLRDANLSGADLYDANLSNANLYGANLDFSCLPLWCGSLNANFDDKQLKQIAYHLVKSGLQSKNASKETKIELAKLIDFANGFGRAEECGKIEVWNYEY